MLGGITIETGAQAAQFTAAMRASPKHWTGRGISGAPIRAGESLNLEPCIPPNWPYRTDEQPCPRVELWPENDLAFDLVLAALPEHTRPLVALYADGVLEDLGNDERRATLARVVRALQSQQVGNWMRAQAMPKETAE
jgi:hypothetical protein